MADAWILDRLNRVVKEVTDQIEAYNFNEAAQCIYDFLWNEYCDWYIELSKVVLYSRDETMAKQGRTTRLVLVHVLETILRLLHPFAPFITEEIWQNLPKSPNAPESIMIAPWPVANEALLNEKEANRTRTLIAIVSAIRNIRGEANIAPSKAIPQILALSDDAAKRGIVDSMRASICTLGKVDNIVIGGSDTSKPAPCALGVADGIEIVIPFADLIDIAAERDRLDKAIAKVKKDLEASERKLNNPNFVSRAKPEVVETEKQRVENGRSEVEKLTRARAQLG